MIDGGLILILVGVVALIASPAQAHLAWNRWQRTAAIGVTLRVAVPIAAPDPTLDRLVAEADAALERDRLIAGVGRVSRIYDRA